MIEVVEMPGVLHGCDRLTNLMLNHVRNLALEKVRSDSR